MSAPDNVEYTSRFCVPSTRSRDLLSGKLRNQRHDALDIGRACVYARSDCRSAEIQLANLLRRLTDSADVAADGDGVRLEFLTQTDRHRILELRSAHLDDGVKFLRFFVERVGKTHQRIQQAVNLLDQRHFAGGRVHVVCGLTAVDVVVRVNDGIVALCAAENFDGAVGDNLVGVHVHAGACAALNGINEKLIVKIAFDDLVAGLTDCLSDWKRNLTVVCVQHCSGFLDLRDGNDHFVIHAAAADGKVLNGSQGLNAVVCILGHAHRAHQVMFNAIFAKNCHVSFASENDFVMFKKRLHYSIHKWYNIIKYIYYY